MQVVPLQGEEIHRFTLIITHVVIHSVILGIVYIQNKNNTSTRVYTRNVYIIILSQIFCRAPQPRCSVMLPVLSMVREEVLNAMGVYQKRQH